MSLPGQFSISAGPLQLVWQWQGDRFAHELSLSSLPQASSLKPQAFSKPQALLESIEGQPDDLWPASPPLQECHLESRGEGRTVALLVGRAGKSHWSLSVLADPHEASLTFEVACRLAAEPQWLGSRYVMGQPRQSASDAQSVVGEVASAASEVVLEGLDSGQQWRLGGAGPVPTGAAGGPPQDELIIPAPILEGHIPRTVQWRYRVVAPGH